MCCPRCCVAGGEEGRRQPPLRHRRRAPPRGGPTSCCPHRANAERNGGGRGVRAGNRSRQCPQAGDPSLEKIKEQCQPVVPAPVGCRVFVNLHFADKLNVSRIPKGKKTIRNAYFSCPGNCPLLSVIANLCSLDLFPTLEPPDLYSDNPRKISSFCFSKIAFYEVKESQTLHTRF